MKLDGMLVIAINVFVAEVASPALLFGRLNVQTKGGDPIICGTLLSSSANTNLIVHVEAFVSALTPVNTIVTCELYRTSTGDRFPKVVVVQFVLNALLV